MLKGGKSRWGKMHGEESGGLEDIEKVMWWLQRSRGQVLSVWQHSEWQPSTAPQCSSPTEGVKPRLQLPPSRARRVCAPWLSPRGSQGSWWHQHPAVHSCVPRHQTHPGQSLGTGTPKCSHGQSHSSLSCWGPGTKPLLTLALPAISSDMLHNSEERIFQNKDYCHQQLLPAFPITSWSSFLTIYIIPILPASHNDTFKWQQVSEIHFCQPFQLRNNLGSILRAQRSGTVP